jgi:hypothetical protein
LIRPPSILIFERKSNLLLRTALTGTISGHSKELRFKHDFLENVDIFFLGTGEKLGGGLKLKDFDTLG